MSHVKLTLIRRIVVILSFALLVGCAGLPGTQIKLVDSRSLELVARAGSGPVVVFENGLGGHMAWWGKVLPALPSGTAYFAYNRPGIGNSVPADTPRDGDHIVEELRRALILQGMRPPYVLVDSTHPRQLEGAGAMKNPKCGVTETSVSSVYHEQHWVQQQRI